MKAHLKIMLLLLIAVQMACSMNKEQKFGGTEDRLSTSVHLLSNAVEFEVLENQNREYGLKMDMIDQDRLGQSFNLGLKDTINEISEQTASILRILTENKLKLKSLQADSLNSQTQLRDELLQRSLFGDEQEGGMAPKIKHELEAYFQVIVEVHNAQILVESLSDEAKSQILLSVDKLMNPYCGCQWDNLDDWEKSLFNGGILISLHSLEILSLSVLHSERMFLDLADANFDLYDVNRKRIEK